MPFYDFENIDSGEIVEVFLHMNDPKVYGGPNGNEPEKWRRVYSVPTASIDSSSRIDPFSVRDFVEKTGKKKGTLGDLYTASAEAAAERLEKRGVDDIKNKFLADYKKDTGKDHFSTLGQTVEKNGFKVTFEKD